MAVWVHQGVGSSAVQPWRPPGAGGRMVQNGIKIGTTIDKKHVHFWNWFRVSFFDFGVHFRVHFGTSQIGSREAKMGPRRPSKASKDRKYCICNNLKNIRFSSFLVVKGHPKQLWSGQKGFQEAPVELQDLKKTVFENGPDFLNVLDRLWSYFWGPF